MAAIVAAVLPVKIVGQVNAPADVESDTNAATIGTLNVFLTSGGGTQGGFITCQVAQSVLATLAAGNATVIISQGAGTVTQAVSQ